MRHLWLLAGIIPLTLSACAGSGPGPDRRAPASPAAHEASARAQAARVAQSMIGVPYRYGGRSPNGFDCSGLVIYSYAEAGVSGLPHSAAALARQARPVPAAQLAPGDLLFFDLDGRKASHVAIYLGDGVFVHAPSGGKRVERVRLDHVYWGRQPRRAGRLF